MNTGQTLSPFGCGLSHAVELCRAASELEAILVHCPQPLIFAGMAVEDVVSKMGRHSLRGRAETVLATQESSQTAILVSDNNSGTILARSCHDPRRSGSLCHSNSVAFGELGAKVDQRSKQHPTLGQFFNGVRDEDILINDTQVMVCSNVLHRTKTRLVVELQDSII